VEQHVAHTDLTHAPPQGDVQIRSLPLFYPFPFNAADEPPVLTKASLREHQPKKFKKNNQKENEFNFKYLPKSNSIP
jgi:hypothetical protein